MLCFREKKTVFSLLLLICTFALIIAFRWEAANSSTAVPTAAELIIMEKRVKKLWPLR